MLVCGILRTEVAINRLGTINVQSLRDRAYQRLERSIVEGALRPHEVLSDRSLSEQLGVSRTPIRDALQLLESAGLVQRRGHIGWSVAGISLQDVEELFELRCLLEPAGLSRIVQWDEEPLQNLTTMFDGFATALDGDQISFYLERDDAFHRTICEASKNSRIIRIYGVVRCQIHRIRHHVSYRYQGRVNQSLTEHRAICRALAKRDEQLAREALFAHLRTAKNKVAELCTQFLEEGSNAVLPDRSGRTRKERKGEGS